jgi:hypothetical protein
MKYKFGSDKNPSGLMKVYARRPGFAEPYSMNSYDDMEVTSVTFTTTHEAIKQILPPPLEPASDIPPMVAAVLLHAPVFRARDGENRPYWELGLWMPWRAEVQVPPAFSSCRKRIQQFSRGRGIRQGGG